MAIKKQTMKISYLGPVNFEMSFWLFQFFQKKPNERFKVRSLKELTTKDILKLTEL